MSQILAWICLVLVASTTAYGLQLTAAAMLPSAAATDQNQLASAPATRSMLIVAVDPVTGDRRQLECQAPSSSFTNDTVLVDANEFLAVAQVCVDNRPASGVEGTRNLSDECGTRDRLPCDGLVVDY